MKIIIFSSRHCLLCFMVVILLLLSFHSCQNADAYDAQLTPPNYCQMLSNDQSHVNYDKSDVNYLSDKAKRHEVFRDNFFEIMAYASKEGFPKIDVKQPATDSCMRSAITITFIHIAQSDITIFFDKKIKRLLQQEIKKGNLPSNLIAKSIAIMLRTNELCRQTKADLLQFVRDLSIESEVVQGETLSEMLHQKEPMACD